MALSSGLWLGALEPTASLDGLAAVGGVIDGAIEPAGELEPDGELDPAEPAPQAATSAPTIATAVATAIGLEGRAIGGAPAWMVRPPGRSVQRSARASRRL